MDTVVLGLRVILAAVFVTASVGKLLDQAGSRTALADFGVTRRLQPAGAIVLPLAELAVAVALLVQPSARWGAIGALLLLAVFIVGIAVALGRGRTPDCHCFGQIHSEPAGANTLVRNGVLAALAVFVIAARPGPSINGWVGARSPAELAITGVVLVGLLGGAFALARWSRERALARARAQALRPPGLPHGAFAPDFALGDSTGNLVTLGSLTERGHRVVLVFTHPGCGPCMLLAPELARWQTVLAERLTIAVVSLGETDDEDAQALDHGLQNVLLQQPSENVYDAYGMRATPSAVVVSPEGQIESVTAQGPIEIEELIRQVIRALPKSAPPLKPLQRA